MMAKCVLYLPLKGVRGGRGRSRGKKASWKLMAERLQQWEAGGQRALWNAYVQDALGRESSGTRDGLASALRQSRRKQSRMSRDWTGWLMRCTAGQ